MTPHKPLRFGIKTPPRHVETVLAVWREADTIPMFEHAWVSDHFLSLQDHRAQPCLESWTFGVLAAQTQRLRIGVMVTGNTYRHPAVLAKMATNVDIIAHGRLNFGIGTGWDHIEHEALGIALPSPGERVRRLGEACELIRRLWTEPVVNFEGRYYQLRDAYCEPRPIQKPYPPFVLAGEGERTLRVIARYADVWDCSVETPEEYRQKSSMLDRHCATIGRDPATIEHSRHISVDPSNLHAALVETRAFIEVGATHIIYAVPGHEILYRLAEEILALAASGTAGFVLVHGPLAAFGAAFLVGLGTGGYVNAVSPTFASAVPADQHGAVFGVGYALRNIGLGLGVLIGGLVLDVRAPQTFTSVFSGSAALLLLVASLFIVFGEVAYPTSPLQAFAVKGIISEPARSGTAGYRAELRDRLLLAITLLNVLLMTAGISQLSSAFPAWTTGPAHSTIQVVGFGFAANSFTIVSLQLFVIRFLKGRRRTRATAAASLVFAGSWLLMAFTGTMRGSMVTAGMIVVAMIIFGSGETLLSPSLTGLVNDLAPDRLRGRYNAIFNLSLQIGPIAAPMLSGWALANGAGGALLVALAGICGSAAVFAVWLERFMAPGINRGDTIQPLDPVVRTGEER